MSDEETNGNEFVRRKPDAPNQAPESADAARSARSPKRYKSAAVTLGGAALIATSLSACATDADYAQICAERGSETRVDDANCETGSARYSWFYVPRVAGALPGIGSSLKSTGGSFSAPAAGSVSRGGFGGSHFGGSGG